MSEAMLFMTTLEFGKTRAVLQTVRLLEWECVSHLA